MSRHQKLLGGDLVDTQQQHIIPNNHLAMGNARSPLLSVALEMDEVETFTPMTVHHVHEHVMVWTQIKGVWCKQGHIVTTQSGESMCWVVIWQRKQSCTHFGLHQQWQLDQSISTTSTSHLHPVKPPCLHTDYVPSWAPSPGALWAP